MKKNQLSVPEKMKPTIYLSDKDLPDITKWEVGGEYKLSLEVKQVSKSVDEYDKTKRINASFEIVKIKPIDGSASSKDFNEFEKNYKRKD